MDHSRVIEILKVVLLVIIAVALQILVVSRVTVLGVSADLFLIFTVIVAMTRGPTGGAVFGFFAGLAADIAYLDPLGVRSLVYVLIGYYLGMLASRFSRVSLWGVLLFAGGSSLFAQFVFGLFQYIMGPREGLLTMLGMQIVPVAILDALIAVPIYVMLVHLRVISLPRLETPPGGSTAE